MAARDRGARNFARIAGETAADTIYQVDRISEAAIFVWFERHWPRAWPVELVMEGIEDGATVTFPRGVPVAKTVCKCILDPIDGTRNLMYDKRSAWILSGLAPQRGTRTHLGDILVAAMTELPTSKQSRADQVSGVRGCGPRGLVTTAFDLRTRRRRPITLRPSRARDLRHGFASLARFFPEGKALTARIEEALWDELYGLDSPHSPAIFDDQYIATGGQIYELPRGPRSHARRHPSPGPRQARPPLLARLPSVRHLHRLSLPGGGRDRGDARWAPPAGAAGHHHGDHLDGLCQSRDPPG